MGIEPTYQLVAGTTGLKPGEPTRCPSAPPIRLAIPEREQLRRRIFGGPPKLVKRNHPTEGEIAAPRMAEYTSACGSPC
jgi:hypothetical protein